MSRNNEPMWHCYECHAEMRPLMIPDPHCASCHGTFVEMIENPEDDPRNFQADAFHGPQHGNETPNDYENIDPMMRLFHTFLGGTLRTGDGTTYDTPNHRRGSDPSHPSPDSTARPSSPRGQTNNNGPGIGSSSSSSTSHTTMRFSFGGGPGVGFSYSTRSGDGETRGNTTSPRGQDVDPITPMNDFLQLMFPQRPQTANRENNEGGSGSPLLFEYLAHLFGGVPNMIFSGEGGPPRQLGDYVLTSEALDAIITQLMENNPNNHRPVPAPEELVQSLPRSKVAVDSELLTKDCAVCKDEFEVNQEVITLPCKHAFHTDCILPWLQTSGTCPVCRHQLVAQPAEHGVPPPGPRPSTGTGGGSDSRSPPGNGPASAGGQGPGPAPIPGAWSELD